MEKTDNVYDVILGKAKDVILEKFFGPEYIDHEETFDITKSSLEKLGATWKDALNLWQKYRYRHFINENAVAEYIADVVPKDKARDALLMAPDGEMLAECLFENGKINWYDKGAYAENEKGSTFISASENGLRVELTTKDGNGCSKRCMISMRNPKIRNVDIDTDYMIVYVESEEGRKAFRFSIGRCEEYIGEKKEKINQSQGGDQ